MVNAKASPRDNNKRNIQESVSLAASRTRGRGFRTNANNNMVTNRTIETKPKGRGAGPITAENKRNNIQNDDEQQITHDMKHISVNDGTQYHQSGRHNSKCLIYAIILYIIYVYNMYVVLYIIIYNVILSVQLFMHCSLFFDIFLESFYGQPSNQQRLGTVPPRMQQQSHSQQQQQQQQSQQPQSIQQQDGSANRPKRYSSLRQRSTISDNPGQQNYPAQHGQHTQHSQHSQHTQHNQHNQHSQHSQHNQHNQHGQHSQHGYFSPQGNKIKYI